MAEKVRTRRDLNDVLAKLTRRKTLERAQEIVDHIREHAGTDGGAPIKTGNMVAGYKAVSRGKKSAAVINETADYWFFVEYGYGPEGPREEQPHVRPAIEATRYRR